MALSICVIDGLSHQIGIEPKDFIYAGVTTLLEESGGEEKVMLMVQFKIQRSQMISTKFTLEVAALLWL